MAQSQVQVSGCPWRCLWQFGWVVLGQGQGYHLRATPDPWRWWGWRSSMHFQQMLRWLLGVFLLGYPTRSAGGGFSSWKHCLLAVLRGLQQTSRLATPLLQSFRSSVSHPTDGHEMDLVDSRTDVSSRRCQKIINIKPPVGHTAGLGICCTVTSPFGFFLLQGPRGRLHHQTTPSLAGFCSANILGTPSGCLQDGRCTTAAAIQ